MGSKFRSIETKIKISESLKKNKLRHVFKTGNIPWNKNKLYTIEQRMKISDSLKGRKLSKNHILNLRKSLKGNNLGQKNNRWNGGKTILQGYIYLLKRKHPFANASGYVAEHRLVMEKQIGRYLLPTEVVHHEDRNRQNNLIENLKLFLSDSEHKIYHRTYYY